ncbi:MAG: hypothetical protein H7Y38_06860 [Armatimonadetes bacterium]|nr:hypothetical protein [Armatimonadota bacterium]
MEKVRERLLKSTTTLDNAQIPYAVAGGNAVASWVGQVDEEAIRNTKDVDVLLRRGDLEQAKQAMAAAGFVYRHVAGMDLFLDNAGANARSAVHLVFAGEKVRPHEAMPNPDTSDSVRAPDGFQVLSLQALVQIKLTAYRDKDRTHLRDMIDVGLIDQSWTARFIPELAARLQALLDDPDG